MLSHFRPVTTSLVTTLFALPLLVACSAAPGNDASAASVNEAVTSDVTAAHCSSKEDCAAGYYCTPSSATSACGKGTCVASPENCPMFEIPVCGCDGNSYLNACWATVGQPGKSGTVSTGTLFVAPTMSELVRTWSRSSGSGSSKTVETLVLGSDGAYTLTESVGCGHSSSRCTQSGSAGTFSLSTVGIVFAAMTSSGALATEFYLENTCPIGGPLQLVGAEPPGGTTMVTLTQE